MWAKQKKLVLAIGGSVLIHVLLLVSFGVAIALEPPTPTGYADKPKPLHLQIVHPQARPTPPPPLAALKRPPARRFVDTTDMAEASPPPDTRAEADKNTTAGSELAPTGTAAAPSQNGRAIPTFMFDTHAYVASNQATAAPPVATPQPDTAPPLPTPDARAERPAQSPVPQAATPAPTAAPDEFAMLEPTPTPKPPDFDPFVREPQTEPPKPTPVAAASTPHPVHALTAEEKTLIHGALSNRGPSSMAALATPKGRYSKMVSDAIRSRWYARISSQMDVASFGTVKIHFSLDRRGKVLEPHVVSNSGNEALASISLQAIMDARIPPVPPEVTAESNSPDLPLDFDFSLY
jgi:outer membrane biosynthesis protein TonB